MVTDADVRTTIGITDTSVLTDDKINLAISDASTLSGQTDDIALRFYTCYLIAQEWDIIVGTSEIEGIKFRPPDPDRFLSLYNVRLKQLRGQKTVLYKVSTNPDLSYDTTYNYLRRRKDGDNYY